MNRDDMKNLILAASENRLQALSDEEILRYLLKFVSEKDGEMANKLLENYSDFASACDAAQDELEKLGLSEDAAPADCRYDRFG